MIILDVLTGIFLFIGTAALLICAFGMNRFPDFYARVHAGGVGDTLGAGAILVGLMFQGGMTQVTIKLVFIVFFLMVTSPTAAHALVKAAHNHGLEPQLGEGGGEPSSR